MNRPAPSIARPSNARKTLMKPVRMLRLLGLTGLGSLAAFSATAQEAGYYYGGLSIGQSHARIDDERITAGLLGAGLRTTSMSLDESDTAFKVFGGYQFNRYFAVEGGYFDLGKFGFTSTTLPAGTLQGQIKLRGFNVDLVGTLPVSERFSVIGRVGVQHARASDSFSGTGAVQVLGPNPSKRDTNYKVGLGLQYEVNPSFLVRGEAERYRIDDAVGNPATSTCSPSRWCFRSAARPHRRRDRCRCRPTSRPHRRSSRRGRCPCPCRHASVRASPPTRSSPSMPRRFAPKVGLRSTASWRSSAASSSTRSASRVTPTASARPRTTRPCPFGARRRSRATSSPRGAWRRRS